MLVTFPPAAAGPESTTIETTLALVLPELLEPLELLLEVEPLLELELPELLLDATGLDPPPPPQPANASAAKASAQMNLVRIERPLSAACRGAINGDKDVAAEEEWQAEIEIVAQHVGAGAGRRG